MEEGGMAYIATSIANKLARATENFTESGTATPSLPETQAIAKDRFRFTILLQQKIAEQKPDLRHSFFSLTYKDGIFRFELGRAET